MRSDRKPGRGRDALTGAIKSVFAIAEAYPELKANQGFLSLQSELTTTEGYIAQCRSQYNDAVLNLNNALQVFPANTVASLFNSSPANISACRPAPSAKRRKCSSSRPQFLFLAQFALDSLSRE